MSEETLDIEMSCTRYQPSNAYDLFSAYRDRVPASISNFITSTIDCPLLRTCRAQDSDSTHSCPTGTRVETHRRFPHT